MSTFAGITTSAELSGRRAWLVSILLGTAQLCVLFDSLAVATALPSIGTDFGLEPGHLQWVVSLYSISIGAGMLFGGRCSDVLGARNTLTASLVLCGAGGIMAGCAPSIAILLVARVVQGLAAAAALPSSLALASALFAQEPWKSRVYSVIATAAWLAALAGAVLGGLITGTWGWRWVFLVTVPAALAAGLLCSRIVPAPAMSTGRSRRLDVPGAALAGAGLAILLVGVEQLGRGASRSGVLSATAALIVLGCFVVVERRAADPLVPVRLLRSRRLVGSCLAFGAYCAGYTALVVVGSLFVQSYYDLSPAQTGLFFTPTLVIGTASAVFAPSIVRKYGARLVTAGALSTCAVAMTGLALSRPPSPIALVPWLALWGLGSGPVFVGLTREVLGKARSDENGTIAALFESMSHIGGGVAASAYLTLLGADLGFSSVQTIAAIVVAAGAGVALWILPRSSRRTDGYRPRRRAVRRSA